MCFISLILNHRIRDYVNFTKPVYEEVLGSKTIQVGIQNSSSVFLGTKIPFCVFVFMLSLSEGRHSTGHREEQEESLQ